MQRMAQNAQGGYENLPLGLVVRHRISVHDRAKTDPATMLCVVVAQAGAHVYTIATKAGVLEKNINKTYLTVPNPEVTPSKEPASSCSLRCWLRLLPLPAGDQADQCLPAASPPAHAP